MVHVLSVQQVSNYVSQCTVQWQVHMYKLQKHLNKYRKINELWSQVPCYNTVIECVSSDECRLCCCLPCILLYKWRDALQSCIARCTLHGTDSHGWWSQCVWPTVFSLCHWTWSGLLQAIPEAWVNQRQVGRRDAKTRLEDLPWKRGHSSGIMRQLQPAHLIEFPFESEPISSLSLLCRTKLGQCSKKMHGTNSLIMHVRGKKI